MKARTYSDSETREVACFRDDQQELELAWIQAHPAAVFTGEGDVPQWATKIKAPIPFDKIPERRDA